METSNLSVVSAIMDSLFRFLQGNNVAINLLDVEFKLPHEMSRTTTTLKIWDSRDVEAMCLHLTSYEDRSASWSATRDICNDAEVTTIDSAPPAIPVAGCAEMCTEAGELIITNNTAVLLSGHEWEGVPNEKSHGIY